MAQLVVSYKGRTIFDGEVAEFTWQESDSDISVKGKIGDRRSAFGALLSDALLGGQRRVPPQPAAVEVAPAEVVQDATPADAPGAE